MMIAQIIQKLVGPLAMASGKDTSSPPMAEGGDAFTALMDESAQVPPEIPLETALSDNGLIAGPTDGGAIMPMAALVRGDVALNIVPHLENGPDTGADAALLAKAMVAEIASDQSGVEQAGGVKAGGIQTITPLPLGDIGHVVELGQVDAIDPAQTLQNSRVQNAPLAATGQMGQFAVSDMPQGDAPPNWQGQNWGWPDDGGQAADKAGATQFAQHNLAALNADTSPPAPADDEPKPIATAITKDSDIAAQNRAAAQATPNDLARISTMPVHLTHAQTGPLPAPSLWQKAQNMGFAPVSTSGAQGQMGDELDVDSGTDQGDMRAQTSAPNTAQIASQMQRQITQWQAFERYLFEQRSDLATGDLAIGDMPVVQTHFGDARSPAHVGGITALPSQMPLSAPPLAAQLLPHAAAAQSGPVEVLLSPQELGQLRFEIQHRGEGVQIILSAERTDTMDLLRRNSEQLLADFRYAGFSGASLSFGKWGGAGQGQGQPAGAPLDDIPMADTAISAPANLFIAARPPADASRNLNLRL